MNRVASVLVFVSFCSCGGAPSFQSSEAPDTEEPSALFRVCAADDDCVAVPRVGCCHNGWKTSVSRCEQDAYAHSFVCAQARPVCPLYLVVDRRVPQCNPSSHLCELVTAQCTPASSN